ncbi:agmatinase family protein [bacterium]|nr:agmatinase family protein [bacterium]
MKTSFDPNAAAAPGSGVFGLPFTPDEARVGLIPVPWEATVSKGGGAAGGPAAILEASRQVDLFDRETGRPYEAGIAMLPLPREVASWNEAAKKAARAVIEAGGAGEDPALLARVREVDALSVRMNEWTESETRRWLERGKLVGVVGGDHSAPFGAIKAHAERFPGLGILHFDAHADLRDAYEGFRWSHASIMANVLDNVSQVARIVQVGIRDFCEEENDRILSEAGRLSTFFDSDLRSRLQEGEPWSKIAREVVERLPRTVYLSFDIDGLDPSPCPSTGTPVLGGLSFAEATSLMKAVVARGRRIVGFDLNEVVPGPGEDWDANVGARVLYKEIGFALLSSEAR